MDDRQIRGANSESFIFQRGEGFRAEANSFRILFSFQGVRRWLLKEPGGDMVANMASWRPSIGKGLEYGNEVFWIGEETIETIAQLRRPGDVGLHLPSKLNKKQHAAFNVLIASNRIGHFKAIVRAAKEYIATRNVARRAATGDRDITHDPDFDDLEHDPDFQERDPDTGDPIVERPPSPKRPKG